jgi:hypothetical protein
MRDKVVAGCVVIGLGLSNPGTEPHGPAFREQLEGRSTLKLGGLRFGA